MVHMWLSVGNSSKQTQRACPTLTQPALNAARVRGPGVPACAQPAVPQSVTAILQHPLCLLPCSSVLRGTAGKRNELASTENIPQSGHGNISPSIGPSFRIIWPHCHHGGEFTSLPSTWAACCFRCHQQIMADVTLRLGHVGHSASAQFPSWGAHPENPSPHGKDARAPLQRLCAGVLCSSPS